MNPATGTTQPIAGVSGTQGNAYPMFGTGSVVYAQAGYKLKDGLLGSQGTFMPYASLQHADYERLRDGMNVFNLGVNWLIKGVNGKMTLNYENRPVYRNSLVANELEKYGKKRFLDAAISDFDLILNRETYQVLETGSPRLGKSFSFYLEVEINPRKNISAIHTHLLHAAGIHKSSKTEIP
jgi:hypothetical protein